ncbi:MAG: CoA transferase [candidate division NC10 bacterium]|nr:CoA transferase [candidate division NC10 bacterium]
MQALENLKVVDFSRILAGPYCTMILADLGAEVVKIEQPDSGDEARGVGPFLNGVSAYFASLNRGKKSVALNIKDPRGRDCATELIARADILVENFRPGTMDRLGLGYETLAQRNPRLIYAACSGFGQTGPYRTRGAYDMVIQGIGGVMSITGEPGGRPLKTGPPIGDLAGGLFTVIGILAALQAREKTGEGQMVDIGMLDCQVALLENAIIRYTTTGEVPGPLGARHPSIAPFEAFEAKDGYVIFAVGTPHWKRFCRIIGREELLEDPRFATNALRAENHGALQPIIAQIAQTKKVREWIDVMEKAGVPCGPINTIDQVVADPQVQARGMITAIHHPEVGTIRLPASPIRLSRTPGRVDRPAPRLGEHTTDVLQAWLGLDGEIIDALRRQEVIA